MDSFCERKEGRERKEEPSAYIAILVMMNGKIRKKHQWGGNYGY